MTGAKTGQNLAKTAFLDSLRQCRSDIAMNANA